MNDFYPCPCCEYLTLSEPPTGTFEICPVCNWEDDAVQINNPNFEGGANQINLNEAKKNYKKFGASQKKYLKEVRKPFPEEYPSISDIK